MSALKKTSKLYHNSNPFSTSHRRPLSRTSIDGFPRIPRRSSRVKSEIYSEPQRKIFSQNVKLESKSEESTMRELSIKELPTLQKVNHPIRLEHISPKMNLILKIKKERCCQSKSPSKSLAGSSVHSIFSGINDVRSKKRRLQAWEIKDGLEKGINSMRLCGVRLVSEVEAEINSRVGLKLAEPTQLPKELIQKDPWEVKLYSSDWFRIISYNAVRWKDMNKRRTKTKTKTMTLNETRISNDSDRSPDLVKAKAPKRAKAIINLPPQRLRKKYSSPGRHSGDEQSTPVAEQKSSSSDYSSTKKTIQENFEPPINTDEDSTPIMKRKKRKWDFFADNSSEETASDTAVSSNKKDKIMKFEDPLLQRAEVNQPKSLVLPQNSDAMAKNYSTISEQETAQSTGYSIDLTVESDCNAEAIDNGRSQCPCCYKIFAIQTIEQHVDWCLRMNVSIQSTQDEAMARDLQQKFSKEEKKLRIRQHKEEEKRSKSKKRREKESKVYNDIGVDEIKDPDLWEPSS